MTVQDDSVFVIAEIGINHNGDLDLAKQLIDVAAAAGCQAVKFQKRTVEKVYTQAYLDGPRESPWGTTQREQKNGLEFGREMYDEINCYCREKQIYWGASAWDVDSQLFLRQYDLAYNKVASAMLTNLPLLEAVAEEQRYTFISTGMSSWEEIDQAVAVFRKHSCPFELMHCVAVYPMMPEEANLSLINKMRERYACKVGYSSHEMGSLTAIAAVALGATSIEQHITLNRQMYGSDQKVSLEPDELKQIVNDIRQTKAALGDGQRVLSQRELETRKKLRG